MELNGNAVSTQNGNVFPWDIKNVKAEQAAELMKYFSGERTGFVRVGPKGYFLPNKYKQQASDIYNMPVKNSDTFIVTYPRSGTTWTQELVWMVANDLEYTKAASSTLLERFPVLDFPMFIHPEVKKRFLQEVGDDEEKLQYLETVTRPGTETVSSTSSPRFIKSHLPLSLLPPALLDTAKVVYVARDPRDVAVSFYHLCRLVRPFGYNGDFKTYWNYFLKDLVYYTPFFEHLKEAWDKRDHPHMLFLFYEDLYEDLPAVTRRVARFLGKQLTEPQVARLCDHLRIDNFKSNKSVNIDFIDVIRILRPGEQSYIRKGKAGGWRDHFDAEMTEQAERWIADHLRDTDLRFPQ